MSDESGQLPLPTLLSQPLVAHTIEVDHLYETRMPHRTAELREGRGPLLVSFALWSNFLRYVDDDGTSLREIGEAARIATKTLHVAAAGMERWRYVDVGSGRGEDRPVWATADGRLARTTWAPLADEVDDRWRGRFGDLRRQLLDLRPEDALPRFLPIARYETGLRAEVRAHVRAAAPNDLSIGELLAQILLAFTVEYEAESEWSLALGANFLRVLDEEPFALASLPQATGASKEAVSFATKFLARNGLALLADRQVRLTAAGLEQQQRYRHLIDEVERRWRTRLGQERLDALRTALEAIVGGSTLPSSPLAEAVAPPPGTWRARRERPLVLPHYPLVLHRAGYPDGS